MAPFSKVTRYHWSKRLFDLLLVIISIPVVLPLYVLLSVFILFYCGSPVLHWSNRIGKNNQKFSMPKFRSMKISTPIVETGKLANPEKHYNKAGFFLRRTSLDELPQIYTVAIGKMSFVGPRPALYNQYRLIEKRQKLKIHELIPGITGWAQINGRDSITDCEKIKLDKIYLEKKSLTFDLKILFLTILKIIKKEHISH